MKNQLLQIVVYMLLGAILSSLFFNSCNRNRADKITTVIKTVTDTTYKHYMEKYKSDSVRWVSLNDSIDFFKRKYSKKLKKENIEIVHDSVFVDKPIIAPLRRYTDSKSFLYGNMTYSATVAGALLDIEIYNDFKIPQITNTIIIENTSVKTSGGLFITAGLQQSLVPTVGMVYVNKKFLIGYQYNFDQHAISVGRKIF